MEEYYVVEVEEEEHYMVEKMGSKKRACVVDDRVVEGVGGAALKGHCLKILDKATL